MPPCYALHFDTVVQLNVIEHTFNAFATLHTAYRLLRPGGVFIFHERIVRPESYSQIYHPIRLTTAFFDSFLNGNYDELYRYRGKERLSNKPFVADEIYFIGRKKIR